MTCKCDKEYRDKECELHPDMESYINKFYNGKYKQ